MEVHMFCLSKIWILVPMTTCNKYLDYAILIGVILLISFLVLKLLRFTNSHISPSIKCSVAESPVSREALSASGSDSWIIS